MLCHRATAGWLAYLEEERLVRARCNRRPTTRPFAAIWPGPRMRWALLVACLLGLSTFCWLNEAVPAEPNADPRRAELVATKRPAIALAGTARIQATGTIVFPARIVVTCPKSPSKPHCSLVIIVPTPPART